jgi:hemolysin activation/secretion protein
LKKRQELLVLLLILLASPMIIFGQEVAPLAEVAPQAGVQENPPTEKPKKPVFRLQIKEIPLGEVRIEGNQYYSTLFLNRYFAPVLDEKILQQKTLERTLRLINEFSDLHVNAILIPKKELISTDLLLKVEDQRPVHLLLETNNSGSRFTGNTLLTATLTWGDITGHGDSALIRTVYAAPAVLDFPTWQVGYTLPVGRFGAKAHFLYVKSRFVVGENFTPLNIRGETQVYGVNLVYPLIRESDLLWDVLSGVRAANIHSFKLDQETFQDKMRSVFFGTYWRMRTSDRNTVVMDGTLTQGIGSSLGGTEGNDATKLNLNLTDNLLIDPRLSFLLRTAFQLSSRSLLVADQFSIGGVDSVRGFTQGEAVGDNGISISGEAQTPLYDDGRLAGAVFLDHGIAFLRGANMSQSAQTTLTSAGVGLRARWDASLSGRLDLGIPLSPSKNADNESAVVTVSVAIRF